MPNKDYIERSELIEHFNNFDPGYGLIDQREVVDDIRDFPAADVEPVIRCRDCKYRDQSIPVHNAVCIKCYEMDCRQGWGFCSMGERMEKDHE